METSGATLSECERYRYLLWREWKFFSYNAPGNGQTVLFIMLNPSTADGITDDATIRRCIGFAQQWGFKRLEVVNLFAYRATDPKVLTRVEDPVGPLCDVNIKAAAERAASIVCAWGVSGTILNRDKAVEELLRASRDKMHMLKRTHSGHPQHPLYLAKKCVLEKW